MNHKPIKFAGLVNSWDLDKSQEYANMLNEMGFCTKSVKIDDKFIVAYYHKTFTRNECDLALSLIIKGNNE